MQLTKLRTEARPRVACVSHRCSQTKQTGGKKWEINWLALQRQGASSNICTWQPPATKGNRGLASPDGSCTTLPPPAFHLLSNPPSPPPAHQTDVFDIYTAFNTSETGDLFRQRPWLEPGLDLDRPPWRPCSSALQWGSKRGKTERGKEGWMSQFSCTFSLADFERRARGRQ